MQLYMYLHTWCCITETNVDERETLAPVLTLPHVFELTYYANSVTPVFIRDSLLGK